MVLADVRAETEMRAGLARLIELIEKSCVEEARRLAPELAARWPESRQIQHFARVLEPPKVVPSRPGPPFARKLCGNYFSDYREY